MALNRSLAVYLFLLVMVNDIVSGQNILTKLEQGVKEILDHLKQREQAELQKEQDKLQDTVGLLNMDSTLKKIEQQTADIARQLRTATGRSGAAADEVQNLEVKIDSMENNVVSNVKGGVRKIEDVQRQADAIKSEMEKRLGKMMNLMSAVHKEISSRPATSKTQQNEDAESAADLFESELFDALERKVLESVSITKETLTSEIRKIKSELLDPFLECKDLAQQVEDMKNRCEGNALPEMTKPENDEETHWTSQPNQEHLVRDITDAVMRNITRVQREINDSIKKKFEDIENRISENRQHKRTVNTTVTEKPASTRNNEQIPTPSPNAQITRPAQNITREEKKDCKALNYEVPKPHSCYELRQAGASCDGPYIIFPKGTTAVYAYCDMTKNGGGWTVLMRRGQFEGPQANFDQNWQAYKTGFGDINKEFWLGNENIRLLTSGQETMVLQVSLEAFDGSSIDITYDQFWIESEENQYKLRLGNANRTQHYQASSLKHHHGHGFTTYDRNNDESGNQNCAIRYRGGWWYNRCHYALLTAPLFAKDQFRHKWQGMQWHAWKGTEAIKAAEMKIKPKIN